MRKKTLNVTNPARINLANHMWKGFSEIAIFWVKLQFLEEFLLFLYNFREPKLTGQVRKSVGRMTWHQEPTKDVTSCDKPGLGANIHRPRDFRMGKPDKAIPYHRIVNT